MIGSASLIACPFGSRQCRCCVKPRRRTGQANANPQAFGRGANGVERPQSVRFDTVVPLRAATTHGRPGSELGGDEAFRLEPIECCVYGSRRHRTLQPVLDFLQDRATVALLAELSLWSHERE